MTEKPSVEEEKNFLVIEGKNIEAVVVKTLSENSQENPTNNDETDLSQNEGSSQSLNSEGDNLPEDNKTEVELSKTTEELETTKTQLSEKEAKIAELQKALADIKKEQVHSLAEVVFSREVEIGVCDEKEHDARVPELVEAGENALKVLMKSYEKIPAKKEDSGAGEPKAKLSEDNKDGPEGKSDDEKLAELREKFFGRKEPRAKVIEMGPDDKGNMRYLDA